MKKIHTNHPHFIRKKDDWTAVENPFRRVLSVACIAGALVFVGAAAGCASGTADTAQNTSAEAEAAGADISAAAETSVDDAAANTAADDTTAANETTDSATANTSADSSAEAGTGTTEVTMEEAKAIALADAGLTEADVTYTAQGQDTDNGIAVYEIDFYTATTEYDYEIQISDGTITKRSTEAFRSGQTDANGITASSCIGVDEAKAIVLNHAGLSESDVTLKKAMLEKDDGVMVYEFEFYHGNTEYEYTVNATTGDIINYERD